MTSANFQKTNMSVNRSPEHENLHSGKKNIENNSFNLLESYLKPSNVYPNIDIMTSSHDY